MKKKIVHPLLGKLVYAEPFYQTEMRFVMFGKKESMTISLRYYKGYPIEENQEEAIRYFVRLRETFGSICEDAIRAHCQRIIKDGSAPQPELVAADSNHLSNYEVHFPTSFDEPTWGLTCVVEWWDKGLGIKIVRDKIVEVGMEHLLI